MNQESPKPTVVLVHGAFEDASIWNGVIERLQRDGYPVVAFGNPLLGPAIDTAYLRSLLDKIQGPVILAAHSYGGAVITQAGDDPKVKGLVYAASIMPAVGEAATHLLERYPGSTFPTSVEPTTYTLPARDQRHVSPLPARQVPQQRCRRRARERGRPDACRPTPHEPGGPDRTADIRGMDKQAELASQAAAGSRHSGRRIQVRSRSRPFHRHRGQRFARRPRLQP